MLITEILESVKEQLTMSDEDLLDSLNDYELRQESIARTLEYYADPRNWKGENENVFAPDVENKHLGREGYALAKETLRKMETE